MKNTNENYYCSCSSDFRSKDPRGLNDKKIGCYVALTSGGFKQLLQGWR